MQCADWTIWNMGIKGSYLVIGVCIAGVLLLATAVRLHRIRDSAVKEADSVGQRQLLAPFERQAPLGHRDYLRLAAYFENGFVAYRNPDGSTASYPGLQSSHGRRMDSIEGFTRIAPLLAAYLNSRSDTNPDELNRARQILLDGWTKGVDPDSRGYWGTIHDNDQRIVEAADVALSIWLLRDSLWLELPALTRERVFRWLLEVNHKQIPDNNWHLFVTYVDVVASSLGYRADMDEARFHFNRFRGFYAGNGWFSDGPGKQFDFYNAWGIAYQLFWIEQAAPGFAGDFIPNAVDAFARNLSYLVGPDGIPIMGRSLCYRMAIVAPLVLDQALTKPSVHAGIAHRALDTSWDYFIQRDGVAAGMITQGYCGSDARLVDNYSGPASCLWGLRSLIAALYLGPTDRFWTTPEEPLPVERADYTIAVPAAGWTIVGRKPDVIVIITHSSIATATLESEARWKMAVDWLLDKAHRPENMTAKYDLAEYRSDQPFCGCARPQ